MTEHQSDRVAQLAEEFIGARTGGPKVSAFFEGTSPLQEKEAYGIQSLLTRQYGLPGAFKVACKPGQPVIMAPIFASDVHPSGIRFPTPSGEPVGIELEFGFKIHKELPKPGTPDFRQRLRESVSLVPVIEVVLTRLGNPDKASPLLRLADNQLNGGLVVGPELRDWQHLDLTCATATLDFGDERVLDAEVPVPGGDAFENLCKLVEIAGTHCGGLQPGQIVITGSLNGLPYIDAGITVTGQIAGLGEVSVTFP